MLYSIEEVVFQLLKSVADSCGRCGRVVSTPVRLTDFSRRPVEETYYACPFCFSRLDVEDVTDHFERVHTPDKRSSEKLGVIVSKCSHEFGYLRNRPKDSSIPDECLTCPRILQCMVK